MSEPLRYFVSYAHTDRKPTETLLALLRPRLAIAAGREFQEWTDRDIAPGEPWREAIDQALEACDFGLLMLSPDFFASRFITGIELAHFIETRASGTPNIRKPIIPVGLIPVPLDGGADLKGLEQIQIFRDRDGRWFDRTRGPTRTDFADQLTTAITGRLGGRVA